MSKESRRARALAKDEETRIAELCSRLDRPAEAIAYVFFCAILAAILGYFTHWAIFETDLFLHIRAGREILETGQIQKVDHWSYTASGQPAPNFEWLSNLVVTLVHGWGGFEALSWLRSALVATWALLLLWGLRTSARQSAQGLGRFAPWALALLLAPWVYLICYFRLQMRPDLFASCFFAALIALGLSGIEEKKKRILGIALLLLWSNFHSGTVPFGLLLFGAGVLFSKGRIQEKAPWILAAGLTWLLTPQGWSVFEVIQGAVVKYDYKESGNPDHQPLSASLFEFRVGGWSFILWILYTGLAFACCALLALGGVHLTGAYHSRAFVLSVGSVFTLLVFMKVRAIHYQVGFFLPVIGGTLAAYADRLRLRKFAWGLAGGMGVALLLWAWPIPDHLKFVARGIRAGLSKTEVPEPSIQFLKRVHPKANLLNSYDFGGPLILFLPEYKVSVDSRELHYVAYQRELRSYLGSVESFGRFLDKYGVNAVIQKTPRSQYNPSKGFEEVLDYPLDPKQWAAVFFDNAAVVHLRRIQEHESAIAAHEYRRVKRGLPAGYGADFQGLPDEWRREYEAEIDRCLRDYSENVYCLLAKNRFLQKRGQLDEGLGLVLKAESIDPKSPEVLLELTGFYESKGDARRASPYQARFDRLTTPL